MNAQQLWRCIGLVDVPLRLTDDRLKFGEIMLGRETTNEIQRENDKTIPSKLAFPINIVLRKLDLLQ